MCVVALRVLWGRGTVRGAGNFGDGTEELNNNREAHFGHFPLLLVVPFGFWCEFKQMRSRTHHLTFVTTTLRCGSQRVVCATKQQRAAFDSFAVFVV